MRYQSDGHHRQEERAALKIWKTEEIKSAAQAIEILDQCKRELEELVEQILVENRPENAELVAALLAEIKRGCVIQ